MTYQIKKHEIKILGFEWDIHPLSEERMDLIKDALDEGRTSLSEYESKQLLSAYKIPVTREVLIGNRERLIEAIEEIGYPIVLKGCSPDRKSVV